MIKLNSTFRILGLMVLVLILLAGGNLACKKAQEEAAGEEGVAVKEGEVTFDGQVKVAFGQYMYVPNLRGFDIVVQGALNSGSLSDLVGREIKGTGFFKPERPSIMIADTLEVKNENGEWTPIFTRSEEATLTDFIDLKMRDEFEALPGLAYNKADVWEGKAQTRVYGLLEGEPGSSKIVVFDDKDKEIGRILVDSMTDFARYYILKLRLFDKFWFYLKVKDTVDWASRRRSREMFHADVVFAGLF